MLLVSKQPGPYLGAESSMWKRLSLPIARFLESMYWKRSPGGALKSVTASLYFDLNLTVPYVLLSAFLLALLSIKLLMFMLSVNLYFFHVEWLRLGGIGKILHEYSHSTSHHITSN